MTTHPVWMVARRELTTRMMTKANIISMAVMLLVIVVGAVVLSILESRDDDGPTHQIGVAAEVDVLTEHLERAAEQQAVEVEVVSTTEDAAQQALSDDESDLAAFLSGSPSSPAMLVEEEADPEVMQVVGAAVQSYTVTEEIEALGGDPAAFAGAMAEAAPRVESINEPEDAQGMFGPAYAISMVMISLLLFALIGSGSLISMGVVEEKTSRVVEILLSTIKPSQLLAGKILGIGLYGLFQVVVLGGAVAASLAAVGLLEDIDVPVASTLALLIVWFLLGFAIFALLFGGFAALVSRQEEIGSVTTPLMFLLFIPFYTTMFMVPNGPDTTMVRVLSQVPFFAPFMMPVRNAFGGVTAWELGLSMVIALATIPLLVWVAARVYRRGVLYTGGRMKLTEALRAA